MSNNVGKLQYRLLLSQWEKGNLQRQLQAAVQDLREARREVLENEEQVEQERQQHDDTEAGGPRSCLAAIFEGEHMKTYENSMFFIQNRCLK